MKSLRKFSLLIESSHERAFSTDEIKIFKILNREKENLTTKDSMIEFISKLLKYLGFDSSESLYYYYLYTANFRKDGRYEEIKKGEESDLSDLKPARTANYSMSVFAKNKIPFKGNNIEGFWEKDSSGEKQFVITSYNWYPIFIFKRGGWYKVSDAYSSSTSKQMGQTGLSYVPKTEVLTPNEMNGFRNGLSIEKLKKGKFENLLEFLEKTKNRSYLFGRTFLQGLDQDERDTYPSDNMRVKYDVKDVRSQMDRIKVDVDILGLDFVTPSGKILPFPIPQEDSFKEKVSSAFENWIFFRSFPTDLLNTGREVIDLNLTFKYE